MNSLEELGAVRDLDGEGPQHRRPCGFIEFDQLHILAVPSVSKVLPAPLNWAMLGPAQKETAARR